MATFGELYAVEREAKETIDERKLADGSADGDDIVLSQRKERSLPILNRLHAWLDGEA